MTALRPLVRPRPTRFAALLVVALAVTACGGAAVDGAGSPTPPSGGQRSPAAPASPPAASAADGGTLSDPATTDPAGSTDAKPGPTDGVDAVDDHVIFSINVQDFARPDESAAIVTRILDLHESLGVPVDLYLTDTIAQLYADQHPAVIDRIVTSPVAAVSYHYRAPRPYDSQYDWLGLRELDPQEQYDTILRYETHAVDPVTGETTDAVGGYAAVTDLVGYAPFAAGSKSDDASVASATLQVFAELGAQLTVARGQGQALNLGDEREGVPVRPEHHDLKLFEQEGTDGGQAIEAALDAAHQTAGGRAPYFVGVKMHDNDFFAEQSAWVTVYVQDRRRPPWDPTLTAPLLTDDERAARWTRYEQAVRYVADHPDQVTAVNLPMVLDLLAAG